VVVFNVFCRCQVLDKVRADLESTGMDSHAVGDTMDDLESV
jgi:hypothetical protein